MKNATCKLCDGYFPNGHYCKGRPLCKGEKTCTDQHCPGCDGCDPPIYGVAV